MANQLFQDLLKADIQSIIAESKIVDTVEHKGIKGNIREYGLGRLLSKYLPYDWAISSGQIIDSEGVQSAQTDLILYNKNILPPLMFGDSLGLFPIESCTYAIEVKTTSTATEIQSTIGKFTKLKQLKDFRGENIIHRVYFAFNSDLGETTELERYKKYDPHFHTNPAINIICIIGKGYWYYYTVKNSEGRWQSMWRFYPAQTDNFEVGSLTAGIINTINAGKPPFGWYLFENGKLFERLEVYDLE